MTLKTSNHFTLLAKKLRFGTETISFRRAQMWNLIPNNIKNASSLKNVKREIKTWNGEKCPLHVEFVKHTCKRWALSKHKRC